MKKILITAIVLLTAVAGFAAARLEFGKKMFNDGLYQEAFTEFKSVLDINPAGPQADEALYWCGQAQEQLGNLARAKDFYQRLREGFPGSRWGDAALYGLAAIKLQLKDYEAAITDFDQLYKQYPRTNYAAQAPVMWLQALSGAGKYQQLLQTIEFINTTYPSNPLLAEVALQKANTLIKLNRQPEAITQLQKIETDYPQQGARYQALALRCQLLTKDGQTDLAISQLQPVLEQPLPREYEKDLRLLLANLYYNKQNWQSAANHYAQLCQKFSQEQRLPTWAWRLTYCRLQQKQWQAIIDQDFALVFKNSPLLPSWQLARAKALLSLGQAAKARQLATTVNAVSDSLKQSRHLLLAELDLQQGHYLKAANGIKNALEGSGNQRPYLLLLLGQIYQNNLNDTETATTFYSQAAALAQSDSLATRARWGQAQCLYQAQNYPKALQLLDNIDPATASTTALFTSINRLRRLLRQHYLTNQQRANTRLAKLMLETDQEQKLQTLADIYLTDLKDYQQVINLASNTPSLQRQQGLALLALASKADMQDDSAQPWLSQLNQLIAGLSGQDELMQELSLKRDLLTNPVDGMLADGLNAFVMSHPSSAAVNLFKTKLALYWLNQQDLTKAEPWLKAVELTDNTDRLDWASMQLALAELHFQQQNYQAAAIAFAQSAPLLNLNKPQVYLHYAQSLLESGNTAKGFATMQFLLKNGPNFAGRQQALVNMATRLRQQGNAAQALEFALMQNAESQDDAFWAGIAADRKALGQTELARQALMRIQAKTAEQLRDLAQLHLQAGSLSMAQYTYQQLWDEHKDMADLAALADLDFRQKDYKSAAASYNNLVKQNYQLANQPQQAVQAVISNYRVENRPRAEALAKTWKDLLKNNPQLSAQVELEKGQYWSKVDADKALDVFDDLADEDEAPSSLKDEASFWHATISLQKGKTEDAQKEFTSLLNVANNQLRGQVYLKLGSINYTAQNYQQAQTFYLQAIEADTTGTLALDAAQNYAQVCKTLKEWGKAVQAYELINRRWPDKQASADADFNIAFCYYMDKKYQRAIEIFEQALPRLTDKELQAEAQYWLGECWAGQENYQKAAAEFLKVGYAYPGQGRWVQAAELKTAQAYLKMGNKEQATQFLDRIISKYGRASDVGKEAAKQLELLK